MTATYVNELTFNFELNPLTTALVVVDMQYASGSRLHGLGKMLSEQDRLKDADYRFDRIENIIIPNTQRLLATFRQQSARVIYLTVGSEMADYSDSPKHMQGFFKATNNTIGNKEHQIVEELSPLPGEPVLNKVTMGGFGSTGIDSYLKAMGISELVLTGVSTNNCVGMTAMEAADKGYGAVLISDATGTCSDRMQDATLETFTRLWGKVMSTDEVIDKIKTTTNFAEVL
jgi:biuret amidohydrolase